MTTKLFFTASLSLISATTSSAQTPTPLHFVDRNGAGVAGLAEVLGQNALSVLLGMVVLMGIAWIFCIWNGCAGLNKKQKNARASSLSIWICVAAGLSVFGSSCTAAQQAQAANIQAARATERGYCVCHAPLDNRNYYRISGMNNRYPDYNYPYDTGRSFCRQCGQRVYYRNR